MGAMAAMGRTAAGRSELRHGAGGRSVDGPHGDGDEQRELKKC